MLEVLERLRAALADRYLVEDELGRGGMATVYRARDLKHERPVALKVLHPELATAIGSERFFREIQIAARLNHPHILPLLDSGQADGLVFYAMPLMDGETLRARLTRENQLSIAEAVRIGAQLAGALGYAHRHGVVHRDIKPENILLHEGQALMADFGIAFAVSGAGVRLTATGLSIGTPEYMSPEQATGERLVDARSDVYSLGAVVYEMLAGEPPHTGATGQAIIAKLMTERPVRLRTLRDTVPEAVEDAVHRALAKVPADRFADADAFGTALTAPAPRVSRRRMRPVLLAGATVLALAGLVVLGRWVVRRTRTESPTTTPALRQITFTGDANEVALSPDGKTVAYVADGFTSLVVQDLDGGNPVVIAHDSIGLSGPRWSPEGTHLLVARQASCRPCPPFTGFRLFVIPRLGGTVRNIPLPDSLWATSSQAHAFAGDDTTFLIGFYRRGKTWLYRGANPGAMRVVNEDSVEVAEGQVFRLAAPFDDPNTLFHVQPAPGRNWVALAGRSSGKPLLVLAHLDTRRPALIVVDSTRQAGLNGVVWAPRAEAIYATRVEGSGGSVLRFPINPKTGTPDGRPQVVLTGLATPAGLSLSAEGRRLVVLSGADRYHLVLVHPRPAGAGGGDPQVTPIPCGSAACLTGALSRDGRRIAFMRIGNADYANSDLMVGSVNGGDAIRVAGGFTFTGGHPVWSLDGNRIAYTDEKGLVLVDLVSGRRRRLLDGTHLGADWASDGRLVVATREGLVVLTDSVADTISIGRTWSPVVSPDGRYAVASAAQAGQLVLVDLVRRTAVPLTSHEWLVALRWISQEEVYTGQYDSTTGNILTLQAVHIPDGRRRVIGSVLSEQSSRFLMCPPFSVTLSASAKTVVCTQEDPNSDIWLAEDFDAGHR